MLKRVRSSIAIAVLLAATALPIARPEPVLAAAPGNDDLANAITISGAFGAVSGSTASATTDDCEPQTYPPMSPFPRSVWYRWTAPYTGWIRWRLDGSAAEPRVLFVAESLAIPCVWGSGDPAARSTVRQGVTYIVGIGAPSVDAPGGPFVASWTVRRAPKPPNDDFERGLEITGRTGLTAGFNPHASKQPGEPAHAGVAGGQSIWYRWRAPESGRAMFHTMGSEREADSVIAVYTGDRVEALTRVTSDAGSGTDGRSSRVVFTATSGVLYHIAIDVVGGREGSIDYFDGCSTCALLLSWNSGPGPSNDAFANARTLSPEGDRLWTRNLGARPEPGEPSHADGSIADPQRGGASSWFRWTAPTSGPAGFFAQAVDFIPLVAVYRQTGTSGFGSLETIAENQYFDNTAGFETGVDWEAVAGQTYLIAVDAVGERTGEYVITWFSGPDNDAFASPRVLPGAVGRILDSSIDATREDLVGEPDHAGVEGAASVWYAWTPSVSGPAQVDNLEAANGTRLAVYTGSTLSSLTPVGTPEYHPGEWTRITFQAAAGTTYRIAVDSALFGTGFQLNWRIGPAETTPPAVALTSPADGAQLPGMIPLTATATDASGIAWVEFLADGLFMCRDLSAPYTCVGTTGAAGPDRPAEFVVRATDLYGNVAETAPRTILGDTGPPMLYWEEHAIGLQLTDEATFGLGNFEAPALGWRCSLDQQPFTDCTLPKTYDGLALGGHWWRGRTADVFGNLNHDPSTTLFEVAGPDTAPPGGSVAINNGAEATKSPSVSLRLHAWDFEGAISGVRISNVASTSGGLLTKAAERAYTTPVTWDLSDAATGGTSGDGVKTVYVQYRDDAGHWSSVKSDTIRLDRVAPTATSPTVALLAGRSLGPTSVAARLSWTGADDASEVVRFELQRSLDGADWSAVALPAPDATKVDLSLGPGHSYRFRVRAVDAAGNLGAWSTSGAIAPRLTQETDGTIAYVGAWTRRPLDGASGGYVRNTGTVGASATLTFTGRQVAWVALRGPARGTAHVYSGSTLIATIDLAGNDQRRLVAFTKSWTTSATRTLRIVFAGPTGRVIDVDAFVVIP